MKAVWLRHIFIFTVLCLCALTSVQAQDVSMERDSAFLIMSDTLPVIMDADTLVMLEQEVTSGWTGRNFLPDPNKSLWYALTFPGLGQIYNRKYWKLPIVYGGALGVVYAISWNGTKYNDYVKAYMDVTDSDPNTNYHLEVIPTGYPVGQAETYVRNRMNTFRRYRDLSIVIGVAFYAITVIDAYVDAQLADFDISPDLSMKIRPKLETQPNTATPALGCQMQIVF